MKKTTYQLSIPNPCHEDWDKMIPEEKGRFCLACQKTVTDFTWMDDAQIIETMKASESLCGRFLPQQLNRPINRNLYLAKTTPWWQAASFVALSLFSTRMTAMPQAKNITSIQQPNFKQLKEAGKYKDGPYTVLKGTVVDSITNEPISEAQVTIYKAGIRIAQALTDDDGYFMVNIDSLEGTSLVCYGIGYERFRMEEIHESNILVKLSQSAQNEKVTIHTGGRVLMETYYIDGVKVGKGVPTATDIIRREPIDTNKINETLLQKVKRKIRKMFK